MKLGIISDCIHYRNEHGQVGTENHILLRQFEQLAGHFTSTTIACAFDKIDDTKVITWYTRQIEFIELPTAGGETLKAKLQILKLMPKWWSAFHTINTKADIVYQRFPNNLNLPGFFYFYCRNKKVFATYTGTWAKHTAESFTYKLQRWLLRNLFRGPVWVYTDRKQENQRIRSGFSPSYSIAEWEEETGSIKDRIAAIVSRGIPVLRLITVGTLISYKNQLSILKACVILKKRQIPFTLTVVGYGPMYGVLQTFVQENNLMEDVSLAGKKSYNELRSLYRCADFVVQAPLKEGFGKVPVEGFYHGAIPVLNNVGMARYMTGNGQRGFLFEKANPQNIADTLIEIRNKIELLPAMIEDGRLFARSQTLESWANEYYATVSDFYKKP